ncbi:MAG: hypothetical protein ABSE21_17720 [Bryobacteraceae bacterium]
MAILAKVAVGSATLEVFDDFRALPFGENEYLGMFEERFRRIWRKWGFEKENQAQSVAC